MQIDHQRAAMRYQNKVNNAQGHFFEQAIKAACALYASRGRTTLAESACSAIIAAGSRTHGGMNHHTRRAALESEVEP